jgi:uncharacterized iron-regulated membrane protein
MKIWLFISSLGIAHQPPPIVVTSKFINYKIMGINRVKIRKLHNTFAPITILPVMITLITGSLFQVANLTGKGNDFYWLLAIHKGKFGVLNLELIYPFFNAFGILTLATTGIAMWLQSRRKKIL